MVDQSGKTETQRFEEMSPADRFMPPGPPLLTKAIGSAFSGITSICVCSCFGVPSILLGALAIFLGIWVRKNYRGTTASEAANVASWIGTIAGSIGIVLGIVSAIAWLLGGGAAVLDVLSQASRGR